MAPKRFHSTSVKLASFGTLPLIAHGVNTLESLTTEESRGRTFQELPIKNGGTGDSSHLLHIIFKSFNTQVPRAEDLSLPFSRIQYRDERINTQFCQKKPEDDVELWDKTEQKWNWALPDGAWNSHGADLPAKTEQIFAAFLNALTAALSLKPHNLQPSKQLEGRRIWSGAYSTTPIEGEVILCKPDIVMSDKLNPGWSDIKVVTGWPLSTPQRVVSVKPLIQAIPSL